MTNYEKIKNMSIGGMAELLQESPFCALVEGGECIYGWHECDCEAHAMKWLNSIAEDKKQKGEVKPHPNTF